MGPSPSVGGLLQSFSQEVRTRDKKQGKEIEVKATSSKFKVIPQDIIQWTSVNGGKYSQLTEEANHDEYTAQCIH